MADIDWINGYMEAILDTNEPPTLEEQQTGSIVPDTDGRRQPNLAINYFVQQMVEADESDLHRAWLKVTATNPTQGRELRMENLSWRVWHLMRKRKSLEEAAAQERMEEYRDKEDGTLDLTEDFHSESTSNLDEEASDRIVPLEESGTSADVSEAESGDPENDRRRLYIVMISLHGLVRGEQMELGKDSDTGGQIKYVVELARALSAAPGVYRVDLLTRRICSPEVDSSYGEPSEVLAPGHGTLEHNQVDSSGAHIVRLDCGPSEKYLRKELLWPYTQEFVDRAFGHVIKMSQVLAAELGERQPVWPYVIHGHYADGGDIAALLSGALNVPMVLTGHSLGRNKLEQLLKQGRQSKAEIDAHYKIMRRVAAEEFALDSAELVVTSTRQEIEEQWGHYDGFNMKLDRTMRAHMRSKKGCKGRFLPRMAVIAPGMDFSNILADIQEHTLEMALENESRFSDHGHRRLSVDVVPLSPRPEPQIWGEINRFLVNPHKPMILALARPDPKKNLTTLVTAFGECKELRELANLTLIMGNRDSIDEMASSNASVLTTVLKLIDKYDLYGLVAYPKHHKQSDVHDIYRLAAKTKGVFINPALVEPFGLTLIEAAALGLPTVATKNGGPVDIHKRCIAVFGRAVHCHGSSLGSLISTTYGEISVGVDSEA